MTVFHLYRLKIEPLQDAPLLLDDSGNRKDIILRAIAEKPSSKNPSGQSWCIGNVSELTDSGVSFAFGKQKQASHSVFDSERRVFIDLSSEEAPYTLVAIDLDFQVCAIARNASLSQKPTAIAKSLAKLLSKSNEARERHLRFTLNMINDPAKFIALIRSAVQISSFEVSFSFPNPWDVEADFHRPLEKLVAATEGHGGKTSIRGKNLRPDIVEQVVSSVASTGNTAKASIRQEGQDKFTTKHLGGDPLEIRVDEVATEEEKRSLLVSVREAYRRVRRGGDA